MSSPSPSSSQSGAVLFVSTLVAIFAFKGLLDALLLVRKVKKLRKENEQQPSSGSLYKSDDIYPPLPSEVVTTLETTRMCFLATQADGEPHLSLMRFSYYQPDEVIILTTRRNTKKFAQIVDNSKVAVLIHDFAHMHGAVSEAAATSSSSSSSSGGSGSSSSSEETSRFSITLNGDVESMLGVNEDKYRSFHRKMNPGYDQFIVGDDIAVLAVRIEKARICDINDKVKHWNAGSGFVPQ